MACATTSPRCRPTAPTVIFDLDGTPADIGFPDTAYAETDPNGLLAVGGDLSTERLLQAYRRGIFPWYSDGQPVLWWSPAPRMVLYPRELHVSRSLRRTMRRGLYDVSVDQAFDAVVRGCAAPRRTQRGTWLVPEMIAAYQALHRAGHAHSFEVWRGPDLVGGVYGIRLGQVFFGESMFSRLPDASKVALGLLAEIAEELPLQLIDCQVYSDHLASLGAREIDRDLFELSLAALTAVSGPPLTARGRRSTTVLGYAA